MTESNQIAQSLKRNYVISVIAWVVMVALLSVAWLWFATNPEPLSAPLITINGVSTGEPALCPGETLIYSYTIHITQPGVYTVDVSTWRTDPPEIVLLVEPLRLVAAEVESVEIERQWRLPDSYRNVLTDQPAGWQPGHYARIVALTPVGRDALPTIASIPFSVREGCE